MLNLHHLNSSVDKMNKLQYRSDIDGLRAIAVLTVFLYHLKISIFSGGFIGVDVFFVISGFLITSIIISSIDNDSFSYFSFFNRRIKRIVPNVMVVATCSVIAGWFILLPNDYDSLIKSYFFTSIYSANVYFLHATGAYFSSSSDEMPLLHMWSLSVEEQFYFIWPMILIVFIRLLKCRHIGIFTFVLAVISFLVSQHFAENDSGFAYYMLPTRSGGLILGASLSLMHRNYKFMRELNSWVLVLFGTVLIITSAVTIDSSSIFPGINSAIPSLGAFFVIAGGSGFKRNFMSRIYSAKPMAWIGLISFSIYLWHWPFIAYATYAGVIDSLYVKLSIFLITIILSVASLKIIENPIRKSKINFFRSFVLINLFFILISLSLFTLSSLTKGFYWRFKDNTSIVGNIDVKYAGIDEGWCHVSAEGKSDIHYNKSMSNCYIGDKSSKKEALYIGDSNAGQYGPFVDELARNAGIKVRQLSTSSCYPTKDIKADGENPDVCKNFRRIIRESVDNNKYDTIIIANRWARNDRHNSYKNNNYEDIITYFASHTKKLVILDQMPEWDRDPTACLERKTCNMSSYFTVGRGVYESRKVIKDTVSKISNAVLVDPMYLMKKDGKFTPFAMGYPMYHDIGHMSIKGMKWISYSFLKENKNPLK